MAVKRGPDGVPVDVPSVMHEKSKQSSGNAGSEAPTSLFDNTSSPGNNDDAPTEVNQQSPGGSLFADEPPTVKAGDSSGSSKETQAASSTAPASDEPATVIAGGHSKARQPHTQEEPQSGPVDAMADPVVGWLVVIDGPGKGNYLKLGNGQNSIGRGPTERVKLDFGDEQISRANHAILTFDPRGLSFYIQQGSGTNLAYLNNSPVLAPAQLSPGSRITLGETTLLFVPLCGENFTWDEE
tara:strand:- start:447 stop:1166 length:720 start_codon:yes stop_codon:yes gene_type:complete